jgi:protein TonB
MRTSLLLSLLAHGAAGVVLALLGARPAPGGAEPAVALCFRAADDGEIERPAEPVEAPELPPLAERWDAPEEAPREEVIEAPAEPATGDGGVLMPRAIRLSHPLPRLVRTPAVASIPAPPAPSASARVAARPPRLLESDNVRYPARARRLGLEGTVVLRLEIGEDGAVRKVEVVESSGHEDLDRAAEEAAAAWRFEPAREDGRAVAHDVRVPVEFRLEPA